MEHTKDSKKNKKVKSGETLQKPLQLQKKKNSLKYAEPVEDVFLLFSDEILNKRKEEKRKNNSSSGKKKRNRDNRENEQVNQFNIEGKSNEANGGTEKSKVTRNKKRKSEKIVDSEVSEIHKLYDEPDGGFDEKNRAGKKEKKKIKSKKKKRNSENIKEGDIYKAGELDNEVEDGYNQQIVGKSKKARKIKKKDQLSQGDDSLLEKRAEAEDDDVYQISSGDEDCSRGMKKWITEYHMSRPGVNVLQQRIDDFIVAHEAQEEQARKEREAQVAEGGWTVVVHHKGRKKTTDSESGTTVGSVAQAAVIDKMTKKKSKDVGLDFYRFQKREAQRNEIMMLQSKFEQDKKRIQQMRAARKFRPY